MGNQICKQICNRQGVRGDAMDTAAAASPPYFTGGKIEKVEKAKPVIPPRPVWSGVPSKDFEGLAADVAAIVQKLPETGATVTAEKAREVFQASQRIVEIVAEAPSALKTEAWAISNKIWAVVPTLKVEN
mmetsp:Transcript_13376/g.31377  ORF Transcript_13376/g.31377 Transcript_13376/m.31377 type:complete len:130 (-) Transcript_13376:147-536(-)